MPAKKGRKRSTKVASRSAMRVAGITSDQWDLPAGFCMDNERIATLRDLVDPNVPTKSPSELTEEQRSELVARRIEMQPKFEIGMLGVGVIDKTRAIAEVRARSKIGRILTEIEQRVINDLASRATNALKGKTPSPRK